MLNTTSAHLPYSLTYPIAYNIVKSIIVAIDGTSSTGKSSIAKLLAQKIDYTYIEELLKKARIVFCNNSETGHSDMYLNGENVEKQIRTMEVSSHVSPVAAISWVRDELVAQQRAMGKNGGIVMDGRDIGTVVFPEAEMKVFMTASPEIRAQRRFKELQEKGIPATYEEILQNVRERDYLDSHRAVSPLKQAHDAYLLDNSDMTFEQEMDILIKIFNEKVS